MARPASHIPGFKIEDEDLLEKVKDLVAQMPDRSKVPTRFQVAPWL